MKRLLLGQMVLGRKSMRYQGLVVLFYESHLGKFSGSVGRACNLSRSHELDSLSGGPFPTCWVGLNII